MTNPRRQRRRSRRSEGGGADAEPATQSAGRPSTAASDAESPVADVPVGLRPLWERPTVRTGAYAWALIGILILAVVAGRVVSELSVVVFPLILALFPAALLAPLASWLRHRGVPRALAAVLVLLGSLAVLSAMVRLLAPAIAAEAPGLAESFRQGVVELQAFLERGPFGLDPELVDTALERGRDMLATEEVGQGVFGAVTTVFETLAGLLFLLVALFFYLKDGDRIAAWVGSLFPARAREDVATIGRLSWHTIGAYFRGQLFVALVDAVFIGLGLWILGVPLAFPLAVLVFFGGLFPIVGAFISGAVAVIVALATQGLGIALAVLALIVAVQQLESNVLAPVVLGKATELHPLAVIVALTVGGLTLGVLGAFLAVPVAASVARGVGHLRQRVPG